MKNILLGLVLGILLASVPLAYTQQESERIHVGAATLRLGMEENVAISKLAELGYKLDKTPGSVVDWLDCYREKRTNRTVRWRRRIP